MNIFKNKLLEDFFLAKGYIKDEFLSLEEVQTLRECYETYMEMKGEVLPIAENIGYYISVFDTNVERRNLVNLTLKKMFESKIQKLMPDYYILYGNFMTKEKGGKEIETHQDFSFVDENNHTAFNFWIPLQDTNSHNGGFHLIEGSNRIFNSYRSASIPHNITHYNAEFKKHMIEIPLKAGEGLIFDHRLFHHSSSNQSKEVRIAVQMVLIPKSATPVTYYYRPEKDSKVLEIYEITEEYLLSENLWIDPKGKLSLIGSTHYKKIPDANDILKKISNSKPCFFNNIKKILKYV